MKVGGALEASCAGLAWVAAAAMAAGTCAAGGLAGMVIPDFAETCSGFTWGSGTARSLLRGSAFATGASVRKLSPREASRSDTKLFSFPLG